MANRTKVAGVRAQLNPVTNAELWNALRSKFPSFKSHTSEGTAELFNSNGFDALRQSDPQALNEFFGLSLRVYLQMVNISHARNHLEDNGFGERFQVPYGGTIQRIAVDSIKPVSPAYMNLSNGQSIDPFVVRKPRTSERFWKKNFNYQNHITIQDFQMKEIFISEFGMSEYMAGILEGLENGRVIQEYVNELEAINAALSSTSWPLQATQQYAASFADPANPTPEELTAFLKVVRDVISGMTIAPQTGAFNAADFKSVQDVNRLKLLVRPGYKNALAIGLLANTYNVEQLNLPVDVIEVPHFGGLLPYKDAEFTTPLYPLYDRFGAENGWSTTQNDTPTYDSNGNVNGATTGTYVPEGSEFYKDPNEGVYAILADKGLIFYGTQNQYQVDTIYNPRGIYTNYFANMPNNYVAYDPIYNMAVFGKASA